MGIRTSKFVFAATLSVAVLLQASAATAQTYDQLKNWCYGEATDNQTIQGCDAVLKSGRETQSNIVNALGNRGFAYDNMKEYDLALQDYDEAIRRSPKHANNYNLRGVTYNNRGQYDRAIQDFDQSIMLNPKDASSFNNRGIAYKNKGQYDRAIQDYDQAIKLNPNYTLAIDNRAKAIELKNKR